MIDSELLELLEELFTIGGSHDISKSIEIRKKLKEFLIKDEYLLGNQSNENVITAKTAIRFIDANNVYANTSDVTKASMYLNGFFNNLISKKENWTYYEAQFLIASCHLTQSVEQTVLLGNKAISSFVNFYDNDYLGIMEGILSCNICARILYAEYFEEGINSKEYLADEFKNWFTKLRLLAQKHHELELSNLVTKIRYSLFNKEKEWVDKYLEELENNYGPQIAKVINREVLYYTSTEQFNIV